MKAAKIWLILLGAVFLLPVQVVFAVELYDAAERGDVAAIQVALKQGADVNTQFDAGKTALMVAAERGRTSAVAALVDAGADLYVLDRNHWDALAHAAEGGHIATVRLLLSKGFDPSRNNWRALAVMRNQRAGGFGTRDYAPPGLVQARDILEQMYKANPGPIVGLPGPGAPVMPRYKSTLTAAPVLIDISERKVTPQLFRVAATRAFLERGWKIVKTEPDKIAGTLEKDQEYRAVITFNPALIRISFVNGFDADRQNWLLNLKKSMERELVVESVQ